eukprot:344807-Hanusia_phi.AAC.21
MCCRADVTGLRVARYYLARRSKSSEPYLWWWQGLAEQLSAHLLLELLGLNKCSPRKIHPEAAQEITKGGGAVMTAPTGVLQQEVKRYSPIPTITFLDAVVSSLSCPLPCSCPQRPVAVQTVCRTNCKLGGRGSTTPHSPSFPSPMNPSTPFLPWKIPYHDDFMTTPTFCCNLPEI